jgi:signal transduction histidine kinase
MNAEGLRLVQRTAEQASGATTGLLAGSAGHAGRAGCTTARCASACAGRVEYLHPEPTGARLELRSARLSDPGWRHRVLLPRYHRAQAGRGKLRAADQRKDEFLAMLAHELRNPLAPISAAADLLRIGRWTRRGCARAAPSSGARCAT